MPDSLKLGIALLVIVSIFFLCVSVALIFIKESEKDKRLTLEARLDEILDINDELEQNLEELGFVNRDLETKLNGVQRELKGLTEDYSNEKNNSKLITAELDEQKKEVKKLVDEVMAEKEEKVGFVQKLAQAENEYQKLRSQLEIVVQAKETLERKVKEIIAQKGVELERIVVETDMAPGEPVYDTYSEFAEEEIDQRDSDRDADVLIVNKKFGFLIVNLGRSSGLSLGDGLEIYRNREFLAEAQIEKLYDKMSAATILPQYKRVDIRPGDEVVISR